MNTLIKLVFSVVIAGFVSTCFADKVVADFGKDQKVTESQMTKWVMLSTGGKLPENKSHFSELSENVQKDLIQQYVLQKKLIETAQDSSISKSDSFKHQLKNAENNLLVRIYLDKYAGRKITDSGLKDQYKKFVKLMKESDDLEVSHILVEEEDVANDVYKKLKKGENFGDLASKHSTDKSTKIRKGKFGKISRGQVFPEYENAAYKLKKGEYSQPIKTKIGWFIIQVDERAKKQIPSFEQIKPQLEMIEKEEIIKQYIAEIAKKIKIDFKIS